MVTLRQIKFAAGKIARQFKPQRITLFGSYARGDANEHSDVDLLILMKGKAPRVHDRAIEIRRMVRFGFPVDLLVRSPEEFERRVAWGDSFPKEIQEKGKVLYEAPDARVDRES